MAAKPGDKSVMVPIPVLEELKKNETPKYVVISSEEADIKLSNLNCFAIHRSLSAITNNIEKASVLRDGRLLALVKTAHDTSKLIKTTTLPGVAKIKCRLHESLNFVKGVVYAPHLISVPEKDIIEELKSQGVTEVYKFPKIKNGIAQPCGVILLTFELHELPSEVTIDSHSAKIREYIPNPMRCKNCQLLGHTTKRCNVAAACVNCGRPPHTPKTCTETKCANCGGGHPASSITCAKYVQQKEILKIKITNKMLIQDAIALYKANNGQTTTAPTSHCVAKAANVTTPTEKVQTQTTKFLKNKFQPPQSKIPTHKTQQQQNQQAKQLSKIKIAKTTKEKKH